MSLWCATSSVPYFHLPLPLPHTAGAQASVLCHQKVEGAGSNGWPRELGQESIVVVGSRRVDGKDGKKLHRGSCRLPEPRT